jgi:hypothetical protein
MKIKWIIATHAMKDETIMQILKLFNSIMMYIETIHDWCKVTIYNNIEITWACVCGPMVWEYLIWMVKIRGLSLSFYNMDLSWHSLLLELAHELNNGTNLLLDLKLKLELWKSIFENRPRFLGMEFDKKKRLKYIKLKFYN